MGRKKRIHGSSERFELVSRFVAERFPKARYVADVAGGQGYLARELAKNGFLPEVIDPRGNTLVGVDSRAELFDHKNADYYDVLVGLHPDGATRELVYSAFVRPVVLVPCCNFWAEEKLGRDALLDSIEEFALNKGLAVERLEFDFQGPKNLGLLLEPTNV